MTDVAAGSDAGLIRDGRGPECCPRHDGARSTLELSWVVYLCHDEAE